MSDNLRIENQIEINMPCHVVWDMLVNPEQTKKYMFGCSAVSEWKVGSELLWKGLLENEEMIFVKGKILEIEPGKMLIYTVIDPNAPIADIPENYLRVRYSLAENRGVTTLTVVQDGFENAADGQRRYAESINGGQGWMPILQQIKEIAES
ncbi:MAG TPA: SRPBCC domain-containing protein [Puia sp.]|nr:SRPBCC domain-containing protein [Puia sp.]